MAVIPFGRALYKDPLKLPTSLLEDAAFSSGQTFSQEDFEGRRLHCRWVSVPAGGVEVVQAVTTHDFVNITDDEVDNTWTEDDFEVVEGAMHTFMNSLGGIISAKGKLEEFRWYKFGPNIEPTKENPQPVLRVIPEDNQGDGGDGMLAHQLAISITEKTPVRKRWGRFYLPFINRASVSIEGVIATTTTADIADYAETLYATCYAAEIVPVVWSPTVHRAYAVTSIQVDNILDVIRSRRIRTPTVREVRDGS